MEKAIGDFFNKHAKAVHWIIFIWILYAIISWGLDMVDNNKRAKEYKDTVYYAQNIMYPKVGMGQALEEFLTNPQWSKANKMSNGQISVGVDGECNYNGEECNAWFNFALNPNTGDVELFVITITYSDGSQYSMSKDEIAATIYMILSAAYERRGW